MVWTCISCMTSICEIHVDFQRAVQFDTDQRIWTEIGNGPAAVAKINSSLALSVVKKTGA